MATDWKQLKNRFEEILNYCTEASTKLDHGMLRPACTEAGKEIFSLIKNDELGIEFDSTFTVEPIVYDMLDTRGVSWNLEHFADYWLCVLAFLGRKDLITVGNKKLRRTKIPVPSEKVCWEAYYHETEVEGSFFSNKLTYLTELCRASIQACDYILKQLYLEPENPIYLPQMDVANRRIKGPSGQWYILTEVQTDLLDHLFKAEGTWVKGRKLPCERPDKIRKAMPEEIQGLIGSHKQHGYRIPSLLSD